MSKKLILFLGIGLSIFLIDLFLNPPNEDKTIYISNEEVIALINTWSLQVGREPNNDEIRSIIDSLIEEEILYREALRLGLRGLEASKGFEVCTVLGIVLVSDRTDERLFPSRLAKNIEKRTQ